jgi:F-type H+-transporting ATPase subunit b
MTTLAEGNFLIPDATFLAELIAFAVILFIIWRFVVPPVKANMDARQDAIRQGLEDSKAAHERLESAEAEFAKAVAEARAEAGRIREEANRQRTQTIEAAKDEARKAAEAVTKQSEERLEVQYRQVVAELRREVGTLAVELAGRIVGESLTDEELQRRVIDRFIAELEADGKTADTQASVR